MSEKRIGVSRFVFEVVDAIKAEAIPAEDDILRVSLEKVLDSFKRCTKEDNPDFDEEVRLAFDLMVENGWLAFFSKTEGDSFFTLTDKIKETKFFVEEVEDATFLSGVEVKKKLSEDEKRMDFSVDLAEVDKEVEKLKSRIEKLKHLRQKIQAGLEAQKELQKLLS